MSKSKPVTHVALIVDRSSSMHSIRQEAIDAFNDQLKIIQEAEALGNENYVTLVTFSTTVDAPHYSDVSAKKVPKLTAENYEPGGSTALLDAMAKTVSTLRELPDADEKKTSFLVVVVTDGEENSSQEYSVRNDGPTKIAALIKKLEETSRWTFVYLCANVDPTKIQESLGLSANNVRSFTADSSGTQAASVMTRDSMTSYFKGRSQGMTSTPDFYSAADSAPLKAGDKIKLNKPTNPGVQHGRAKKDIDQYCSHTSQNQHSCHERNAHSCQLFALMATPTYPGSHDFDIYDYDHRTGLTRCDYCTFLEDSCVCK